MKNQWARLPVLLLFCLLLFNSACKNEGTGIYVITSGEGRVYYDGIAITTDLFFSCTVMNQSDVAGTITGWKIVFKSGSTELLEINSTNCAAFHMDVQRDLRVQPRQERIIVGKTVPALDGSRFVADALPDNMDITVTIEDDHDNQSAVLASAAVRYDEYND